MKVLIIDNYDSFTYNLYQFIGEILLAAQRKNQVDSFDVIVKRNDEISLAEVRDLNPDRIIISPGPGSPDDERYFGVCAQVITELGPTIPLLGVCLGMQGIVHCFGGKVVLAPLPMHGKISPITHGGDSVFAGVPDQLEVMRYHSLIAEAATLPDCLMVTAAVGDLTADQFHDREAFSSAGDFELMGVRHRDYPIHGIQFHPESFATEGGKEMLANFVLPA
ncbi:anthranilate synthase component II [Saccharospirillum mangrovi]|uniref:anthranilate synthase component II n=1 Tax=Saccharospirillum mangrovi TaxID=2161747 RepID=UPI000D3B24A4|nr:aminodeoxychorismate/anthranilate synthase component II [Saccharospirillum mangrovi]